LTLPELEEILKQSLFRAHNELESKKWYYVLLQDIPHKELTNSLQQEQFPKERFMITNSCVCLSCDKALAKQNVTIIFSKKTSGKRYYKKPQDHDKAIGNGETKQ